MDKYIQTPPIPSRYPFLRCLTLLKILTGSIECGIDVCTGHNKNNGDSTCLNSKEK